jgi:predicted TIM-barrel fold metal-dependent hydrolase
VVYALVFLGLLLALAAGTARYYGLEPADASLRAGNPASRAYLANDVPSLKVTDLGPRKWKIINVHEHLRDMAEAERLLRHMDALGVQRTCLLGASKYTFTLDKQYGFEEFEANNQELLKIKARWPDRYCAFITFDPGQGVDLPRLQAAFRDGADGVKLFLGHGESHGKGPFHDMPLDDPRMEPVYVWLEAEQIPIVYHVNLKKYWDEFLRVMEAHPYLRVDIAHFGLQKGTAERLARLGFLLDRYPNVYSDISFGHYSFQSEGFEALAKWRSRSHTYLRRYQHKMLFASDMVLEPTKTEDYISDTMRAYMQLIESKQFRFFLLPEKTMHGLELGDEALRSIYETSPAAFLLLDAEGRLPDRRAGWPVAGLPEPPRPPIPPLSSVTVPAISSPSSPAAEPASPPSAE